MSLPGAVDLPSEEEIHRITSDPAFAEEAVARWGMDVLMDPMKARADALAQLREKDKDGGCGCGKHNHEEPVGPQSRLFRSKPGCKHGEKIPYGELPENLRRYLDEQDVEWPGRGEKVVQEVEVRELEVVRDGHLGGFVVGGDPATLYPTLWRWLVETWGARSVLDVGCGDGTAIDFFAAAGAQASGVDGISVGHPNVLVHDFTTGPASIDPEWRPDVVWCSEFVEHVDEQYVKNFAPLLAVGDTLLLTHATPGQPGHHHVNCQTADYWRGVMAGYGMRLDERLTVATRVLAARDGNAWSHYVRSGLAFVRELGDEQVWQGWMP